MTTAPIPPAPATSEWRTHVIRYRALTMPEKDRWFASLTTEQKREFRRAFDGMGMNFPPGVTCPNCQANVREPGLELWAIVVAVLVFPIGLLALAVGKKPATCQACGYTWKP